MRICAFERMAHSFVKTEHIHCRPEFEVVAVVQQTAKQYQC